MDKEIRLIGVFDSGIGGLTVFKELNRKLPEMRIVYLGDTARVPYGVKSKETVVRYSMEAARFLTRKGVDLIVVACNTSSALAMDQLRKSFDIPIIGVIEAGARRACGLTRSKRIGVIGTHATVKSEAYRNEIQKIMPGADVRQLACPLFVPLVEEGWTDNKIARNIAEVYLDELKRADVDTLILGCTHYPLLKKTIAEVMGAGVKLIDSAESIADDVWQMLYGSEKREEGGQIKNSLQSFSEPELRFYVTDSTERFIEVGSVFLGFEIRNPQIVDITGE
ncbi:MAG: glutamate racemase [Acidobacteriota bacterium]